MKPALLVVDDEQDIRDFLVFSLVGEGEAVGARTGEDALRLARSRDFDVALCDFMLPGLRGFDLVQALQGVSHPPAVIMVTGYADEPMAVEAKARGVFAVFGKPFDLEALIAKVREAITARRGPKDPFSNASTC